jgi:DNA-binding NarL/FixJ family response regulator
MAVSMPSQRPWTPADEERLVELRARGLTWRTIAQRLLRSEASVIGRAAKLKLEVDNARRRTQAEGGPDRTDKELKDGC